MNSYEFGKLLERIEATTGIGALAEEQSHPRRPERKPMNAKELDAQLSKLNDIQHILEGGVALSDLAIQVQGVRNNLFAHRQELEAAEKRVPTAGDLKNADLRGEIGRVEPVAEKEDKEATCHKCGKVIPDGVNRYFNALRQQFHVACLDAVPPTPEARLKALEVKQVDHRGRLDAHWDCIQGPHGLTSRLDTLETGQCSAVGCDIVHTRDLDGMLESIHQSLEDIKAGRVTDQDEVKAELGVGAAPAGVTPEEHAATLGRLYETALLARSKRAAARVT